MGVSKKPVFVMLNHVLSEAEGAVKHLNSRF
jgi:hypothetical protein